MIVHIVNQTRNILYKLFCTIINTRNGLHKLLHELRIFVTVFQKAHKHRFIKMTAPIMAGLGAFVKLNKEDFIGREALLRQKNEGVTKKLIGIELKDKAIPRHGYSVLKNGIEIGKVTTGYHCLSVDKSVCMALVNTEFASLGTEVEIQIRKKTFPGTIVKKKFYEKHYKK